MKKIAIGLLFVLMFCGCSKAKVVVAEEELTPGITVENNNITISYIDYSYAYGVTKQKTYSVNRFISAIDNSLDPCIGEYCRKNFTYYSQDYEWVWEKFRKSDIRDDVDGFTKMYYGWTPNTCIIYYDGKYKDQKVKVEKIAEKEYEKVK